LNEVARRGLHREKVQTALPGYRADSNAGSTFEGWGRDETGASMEIKEADDSKLHSKAGGNATSSVDEDSGEAPIEGLGSS